MICQRCGARVFGASKATAGSREHRASDALRRGKKRGLQKRSRAELKKDHPPLAFRVASERSHAISDLGSHRGRLDFSHDRVRPSFLHVFSYVSTLRCAQRAAANCATSHPTPTRHDGFHPTHLSKQRPHCRAVVDKGRNRSQQVGVGVSRRRDDHHLRASDVRTEQGTRVYMVV